MKINQVVNESPQLCPECGGPSFSDLILAEKKDACYNKVRSRYKVWPSAYASGALVQCRKKGAANWGNKSKNESVAEGSSIDAAEALRDLHYLTTTNSIKSTYAGLVNSGRANKILNAIKACSAIYNYFKNNKDMASAKAIENLWSDLIAFKNGDISTLSQLVQRGTLDKINLKEQGVAEDQVNEISANPDYLRAAERSLSQARDTQRQYWKSPEEKAAARKTELKREKGIGGYTKRHRAANPDMYPAVKSQPAPKLRDPSTEYSDDYSVWAAGRRDTMEQGVAEGSNVESQIKRIKDRILQLKDWNTAGTHDKKIKELQTKLKELQKQGVAEGSNRMDDVRIGDIVRAVVDGKRVQGEVIDIFPEYGEVELWLDGINAFNPVTVDVQDTEAVSEQGVAEGYPKHQDLSGISTDKLKAYLDKQSKQQVSGEGNQVKRVRAELQRRQQGVAEGDVEEGLGTKLAGLGLAGAMALGSAGANARVTPDGQGGYTGGIKPAATATAPNVKPAAPASQGFSKEYLQRAADPNRTGRYMISVEKAQELLSTMQEGDISQLEKDIADAPVKPIANMESATDSDGYAVDQEDAGEYDYEGDQAKDQLQTIVAAARKLDGILDDNENMPEWVQMKITKATDYLDTAADYVAANKAQAEPMAEADKEKIGGRYDPADFDSMVSRLKKLAGAGPMKTVYDPNTRRYKNIPTAVQPQDKK